MQIKSKSGHIFELPSDKEEQKINAGIQSDPNPYELSDKEFSELQPPMNNKDVITLQLSTEVTKYFKSFGKNWRKKVNTTLLEYVATHSNTLKNNSFEP